MEFLAATILRPGDVVASEVAADLATQAELDAVSVTAREDLATFSQSGVLAVGAGVHRFRFPFAATLLGVSAAVGTAPAGASLILDVNLSGTTIYTTQANRPTIAAGANATTTEPAPDVTAVAAGGYLSIDRDQIGSTTPGSDLVVQVRYRRT